MASNSSQGKTSKKPITRRRKIEIKKVEELNKRHVTFSKRKLGLFNKVTELSILCQAETALIVTSPNGKLYACGYPNPDTVIKRFLTQGPPVEEKRQQQEEEAVEILRQQYEAIQDQLKAEKKNLQEITEAQKSSPCFPSWWNLSIEDMNLESLEHFMESMKLLRLNLVASMQEKKFVPLQENAYPPFLLQENAYPPLLPIPISVAPPPAVPNWSLNGVQQQLQHWKSLGGVGSSTSSTPASFMVTNFGLY